ncbi:MAG: hypothetical protein E7359_00720 [Clostridiales bacterium]|nr:hypothetical protein [Clostridiales bacterium]
MEQYGKKGPYTNAVKNNYILEKFYEENFQKKDASILESFKVSKVNLATNEVVEGLETPLVEDYVQEVLSRKISVVSDNVVEIAKNQECLNLIFYCSANYFDMSNPQKGICSGKNEEIIANLSSVNPNGKTVVVFGGDLLGEEWQIKYLKNARIENNKALYFGLNKRKNRLIRDIKKFFSFSEKLGLDIDIYLMRGHQEHFIIKELNRDIFEEVVLELQDKYVSNGKTKLHYLSSGVSLALNVVKKNKNKPAYSATIGLQTNMKNKTLTARGEASASYSYNGSLPSNVCFVCNGNFAGKLGDRTYHVSGQSQFIRTPKGKKPQLAPKGYNVFTVYVENDNELTVQEGGANIFPKGLELQNEEYKENKKQEILLETCEKLIKDQLKEIKLSKEN